MAWTDVPTLRLMKFVAIVFLTVAVLLLASWLTLKLWSLIILIGLSLLFGTALLPFVDWVGRYTQSRGGAVFVVMLTVLAVLILFGLLVLPPMVSQGRALYENAPQIQEKVVKF